MSYSPVKTAAKVKAIARTLGFEFCGISEADFLEAEAPRLEQWLKQGKQGQMQYLENHFDKRLDPRKLVPGAKSVISLLYNYAPPEDHTEGKPYKVARYAYGRDYHKVIKKKLKHFLQQLQEEVGEVHGRCFVDSAPVLERPWAAKAGLGWVGKNTLLLNRQRGSYFFLAEMILDLPLTPDAPMGDYCGTCTRCIDACPTDAITPYEVDGSKCISYLTIELKDQIPQDFKGKMADWIFGCDICQEVCPWNRFSQSHQEPDFAARDWKDFSAKDWEEMTEEVFQKVFNGSAVKRTGFEGLKRNIEFVKGD